MRSIAAAATLIASASLVGPQRALAWDDQGHEIVALVAEHYLTPGAAKKVQAILKTDTDQLTRHDLASEATWADKVQNSEKETTKTHYDATIAWHYADISATRPNIPEACFGEPALPPGTPASRGPAKACVVDKINQFSSELADPRTTPEERLLALKFLLNLVGDAHQPLRVADEQNGHGAMIVVVAKGITRGDLFHYWDSAFVRALGSDPKEVARRLTAKISDADARQWASGAPHLWVLEAHQLGVDRAYGISAAVDNKGRFALQDRDVADGVKTVALQLSRAGVRLAYLLNTAFGAAGPSAQPTVAAGDKVAGHTFALATCSVCHVIDPDQASPRQFTNAPDFQAVANTRGMSELALHEFLFGPHPTMPRLMLSEKQADDVAAFIMSLKSAP